MLLKLPASSLFIRISSLIYNYLPLNVKLFYSESLIIASLDITL